GRVAKATIPDGVETGLIASITVSDTCTTRQPTLPRVVASLLASPSEAASARVAKAAVWMVNPAARASWTRWRPASSIRLRSAGSPSATLRASRTRGFLRLAMVSMAPTSLYPDPARTRAPHAKMRFSMKAQLLKRFEDEIQTLERELKTELPKEIQ